MTTEPSVILLISEEYGYRDWLAVLSPEEFDQAVQRWQTIKGLSCLVPVPLIFPQAYLSSAEEFIAAREQADASGDRIVHAHVHECDDSHLGDVEYVIPEAENFEMEGRVYSEAEIMEIQNAHKKDVQRDLRARVSLPSMPERTVTRLLLLKNRILSAEQEVFSLRQEVDLILDELVEHLKDTNQITFSAER